MNEELNTALHERDALFKPVDKWWDTSADEAEYADITPEVPQFQKMPPVVHQPVYQPDPAEYHIPPSRSNVYTYEYRQPTSYQQPMYQNNLPSGLAITALVISVVALLVSWMPLLGLLPAAVALIFGIVSRAKGDKTAVSVLSIIFSGFSLAMGLCMLYALMASVLSNPAYYKENTYEYSEIMTFIRWF